MNPRYELVEGAAARLADRLRDAGLGDRASLLAEATVAETSLGGSDAHLARLCALLTALAADTRIPSGEREHARTIVAAVRDLPARLGRQGTVWVAWDGEHYTSYWDADPGWLEEGPTTRSLVACLAWAAQRSPRVLVRPESDPGRHYWAGDGESPDDVPPLGI